MALYKLKKFSIEILSEKVLHFPIFFLNKYKLGFPKRFIRKKGKYLEWDDDIPEHGGEEEGQQPEER